LRESSHRYAKTKDQELVEYLADGEKIGEQMRYEAVNEEGDRLGDVDQLRMMANAGELAGWDSLSERIRKMRDKQQQQQAPVGGKTLADFDEEERTRKVSVRMDRRRCRWTFYRTKRCPLRRNKSTIH
jgi:hypothetical protein